MKTTQHTASRRAAQMALGIAITMTATCQLQAGVIFLDEFSTPGAPGAAWVTDAGNTANATVNVSSGELNLNTGTVTGLDPVRHTLALSGTGAPSITLASDWTIEATINISSAAAFATAAGGEGVGISLDVRNTAPLSDDRANINVVALNFGSGLDHALRGAGRNGGSTVTENITNIGAATSAQQTTMRMAYDSVAQTISFGANAGSGFIVLTPALDTSSWSGTDPLQVAMELAMVSFSGDPAVSTFSVEDGEVTMDSFSVYDEVLFTGTPASIPEPSSTALLGLSALSLLTFRKRSA